MSDLTEIVTRQFTAWNQGDLDTWAEAWDPEVVVIAPEGWPDGEVNRGLDAWRSQAQRLRDTWADARIEVDEIRAGGNCVVVRIRYVTIGGDTGLPFETPMAAAFFLEDGRITLGQYFWEFGDALSAAGFAK